MKRLLIFAQLILLVSTLIIIGFDNTVAASAKAEAATADRLVVACNYEPDVMDTATSKVFFLTYPVLCNIYEQNFVPDMNGNWMGLIGESEHLSPDGSLYTVKIRQGVTFHNGYPMTAEDVVWSLQRRLDIDPMWQHVFLSGLDRYEVVDDYTINFHLKKMDWQTIMSLRQLQYTGCKAYWEDVGEEEFYKHPVGTGPYKFEHWERGQYLDLVANENYWGGAPEIKKVRIMFALEDTTRLAMLKTGEVDMITDTPWESVASVEKAGFKTEKLMTTPLMMMRIHCINPDVPWSNKKVRQAMAYAIDRKALIDGIFGGIPGYFAYQAPGDPGYDPNLKPYPYDVAKAKQLLKEAGYENGFDIPFIYRTTDPIPNIRDITDYIVSSLKMIKINCIDIKGMDEAALGPLKAKLHNDPKEKAGIILEGLGLAPSMDPTAGLNTAFSSTAPQGMYANAELDSLITASTKEIDDTKRAELIRKAIAICYEELPMIPILANNTVYSMKSNVNYPLLIKDDFRMIWIKNISVK